MSRLKTQHDAESSHSLKINMILNNINRINTQNSKLQQLFFLTPQINQLKQVVNIANSNWQKIASVAEKVHKSHQQAVKMRNMIHTALQRHGEHVNKGLLAQVQNCKTVLVEQQNRFRQVISRQSAKSKQYRGLGKKKVEESVVKLKNQCIQLLQKAQKEYCYQIQPEMESIKKQCESQIKRRQHQCRVGLGHLYNLTAYYHHQKHRSSLEQLSLADMAQSNFVSIGKKLDILEIKQKRIKNQIQWLKSKSSKERNKKHKQSFIQPQETNTIAQISTSLSFVEYQLKGLDRICSQKSRIQNKLFNSSQINSLIKIKERLVSFHNKLGEYSMFYKQSF